MTETTVRSITNNGIWMLIGSYTFYEDLCRSNRKTTHVVPFVIGMLLARDSIGAISIPSSISLSTLSPDVYYATLFLYTRVGPPSAKFCRTVAIFPQVDDLRFINPWEV